MPNNEDKKGIERPKELHDDSPGESFRSPPEKQPTPERRQASDRDYPRQDGGDITVPSARPTTKLPPETPVRS